MYQTIAGTLFFFFNVFVDGLLLQNEEEKLHMQYHFTWSQNDGGVTQISLPADNWIHTDEILDYLFLRNLSCWLWSKIEHA